MNNKTLGTLALLGAPGMGLGIWLEEQYKSLNDSWFTGLWGLIYITAWMGSMIALRGLNAAGTSRFGQALPLLMLGTLTLANVSNIWQLVAPANKSSIFWTLDIFWPLSNVLMLIFGITVAAANRLTGWKRFVPLLCGLWLPFALTTKFLVPGQAGFQLASAYCVVSWSLLAIVVLTTPPTAKPAYPNALPV